MRQSIYLIFFSLASGFLGFLVFVRLYGSVLPVSGALVFSAAIILIIIFGVLLVISFRSSRKGFPYHEFIISSLIMAGTVMVLATLYQFIPLLSLPVDLLSFAESPFVTDIIKLRIGVPFYTSPLDNNSYPYAPGAQIITFILSSILGRGESIPVYRGVLFFFVILAAFMSANVTQILASRFLDVYEYRYKSLWVVIWLLFGFLLITDPQFNPYIPSLHNDGLALLVTITGFWLLVRFSNKPARWLLIVMACLPAAGFLVKQNQLMWYGIFLVYFVLARLFNFKNQISWKQIALFAAISAALVMGVIAILYVAWGENFRYWVFNALGDKEVSLARSFQHLFMAGSYAAMGLFAGYILVLRKINLELLVIWLVWGLLFALETYTSGIGFVTNHMGPGVVIAGSWFFVAVLKIWPRVDSWTSKWLVVAKEAVIVASIILLFGGLGLVREPYNPVSADFDRYVAQIEAEFAGLSSEQVLMDFGSWIYLRDNVIMKDRSASVSLHVGMNQPEINREMLVDTIDRIENKVYKKVLARQIDTGETAYDFQDRGSGVKEAILSNYHEVRRIPAVAGIQHWWPLHLVSEIVVLEPNQ